MKKLATTILFLIAINQTIQAQLFVKDSYVYVADKSIYVTQDINLNTANSFIYLRNDAQILQGTTGAGANSGLGSTSVYQEGTSNAFAYNYWSSPVGGSNATVGNSNFGIVQLGAPTSSTNTTFTAPGPISGFPNGQATNGTLQIASRWIYTFISSLNYSDWTGVGNASTIPPGYGFTMKGTSGTDGTTGTTVAAGSATNNNPGSAQRYDFRGKPNDGTISATVAIGKLTLVGNPYPSAIDLNIFLSSAENPNCDGTALYWDQPNVGSTSHNIAAYKGGYQIYNGRTSVSTPAAIFAYDGAGTQIGSVLSTGTDFKRRFCPVGQGFMIMGTANGNVTFKNSHRAERKENSTDSQFNRNSGQVTSTQTYPNFPAIPNVAGRDYTQISSAPAPHIRINALMNNTAIRQIALVFLPDAHDNYDRSDAKSPDAGGGLALDMYLPMINTEFVQSCKAFNISKTFQLGFKNNVAATFRLQVAEFVNFNDVNNVFLHDIITNQYFDIKNASYQLSLPAGTNNTRYEITFQTNLSTPNLSILNTLNVYHNDINNSVSIKNPKKINLKSCTLYDISGKVIFTENNLGSNDFYSYSTLNLSDGIYIVKLTSEDGEDTSKKIVVFNTK